MESVRIVHKSVQGIRHNTTDKCKYVKMSKKVMNKRNKLSYTLNKIL